MILLDTHVVVWLALEPSKISRKARTLIETTRRENQGLAISDITLLEISILERKGRIKLSAQLETFLTEIEARFIVLPITATICAIAMQLSKSFPKDPADRILAATSLAKGIVLVTADKSIQHSKAVNTVW